MGFDIGNILDDWPHENSQLSARRITGADGRDKLQMRLELGLLQMEITGRPDGKRPYGFESLQDYYRNQLQLYREGNQEDQFSLDKAACEALRGEAAMYYHRYISAFILEDFDIVQRDTQRNLDLMDFCSQYAAEESDKHLLEHYRPYVVMMNTRARARLALADNQPKVALAAVRDAIDRIQARGITVNGCFVIGLDGHGPDIFDEVSQFVRETGLFEVQITIQTPFPGTPLYDRLADEDRLLTPTDWARATLFDLTFRPANMTADQLNAGFKALAATLYSDANTHARREAFFAKRRAPHAEAGD